MRLPRLSTVACAASTCTLTGGALFLLRSVNGVDVPDGFTGTSLSIPRAARATMRLRDDPTASATIDLPDAR